MSLVDTDRLAPLSDPLAQAGEAADRIIPLDEEADAWESAKARADVEPVAVADEPAATR